MASDMVKDHSDSERGNALPPLHGLLFSISSMGSFICTSPQAVVYLPRPVVPVVEYWLERKPLKILKQRGKTPISLSNVGAPLDLNQINVLQHKPRLYIM